MKKGVRFVHLAEAPRPLSSCHNNTMIYVLVEGRDTGKRTELQLVWCAILPFATGKANNRENKNNTGLDGGIFIVTCVSYRLVVCSVDVSSTLIHLTKPTRSVRDSRPMSLTHSTCLVISPNDCVQTLGSSMLPTTSMEMTPIPRNPPW